MDDQRAEPDPDLLFAMAALDGGFVSQDELVDVLMLLARRRAGSAEDLFVGRGYLEAGQVPGVRKVMAELAVDGGDDGQTSIRAMAHPPGSRIEGLTPCGRAPGAPEPPPGGGERYILGRELGRGGLGRVVVAIDRELMGREVAMKLMLHRAGPQAPASPGIGRFLEEARLTAQLEHPNIVAVHEMGTRPSNEVYYTMPVIRGRPLKDAIREAHARLHAGAVTADRWGLERLDLLGAFQGVCNAIAYAHSRGVIHRDIKPQNVMVGEYGESIVVDWGLAKAIPRGDAGASQAPATSPERDTGGGVPPAPAIRTARGSREQETVEGTVVGTAAYMSPEQAAGNVAEVDERSDIYSLGAVLYEILAGRPPYVGGTSRQIAMRVIAAERPPDPRAAAGDGTPVPDDLAEACLRAMAPRKSDRHASARELLAEVVSAIEGGKERQRRHEEAERLVAVGRERSRRYLGLEGEQQGLQATAEQAGKAFRGPEPVAEKRAWWRLQDEAAAAGQSIVETFAQAERAFHQALEQEHGHAGAREGLADLYYHRFAMAEAAGVDTEVRYFGGLVRSYHDGKYERRLRGDGSLSITTDPSGAEVYLCRYEERDRRLIPVPWKAPAGWEPPRRGADVATTAGWYLRLHREDAAAFAGDAPVSRLGVPMGSYLAIVRKEGFPDVRVPVRVGRNEDVDVRVRLYDASEIGAGFVHVPAGPFVAGGDPMLSGGRAWDPHVEDVPDVFVGRFPVTCAEYLEFLNDIGAREPEAARKHAPRSQGAGDAAWVEAPAGAWRLPEGEGIAWRPDGPVVEVSWHDAVAYAAWRSAREGREVRLPSEAEWEKAARGVDGRAFPWGQHFDATWCNSGASRREGGGRRGPVGEFPVDESPYGVRDLAGNVLDWCQNLLREDQDWRAVRGGRFTYSGLFCRVAHRFGEVPGNPGDEIGFRVVAVPRRSAP